MLALGIVAAYKIADGRWKRMGGDPKVIPEIGVPVVVCGIIGARVYHLFTGYDWDKDGIANAFAIWKGGLRPMASSVGGCPRRNLRSASHTVLALRPFSCLARGS